MSRGTKVCLKGDLPCTQCLKDTVTRFLPYWNEALAPSIRAGARSIIAAHGNPLRALVKYVDEFLMRTFPSWKFTYKLADDGILIAVQVDGKEAATIARRIFE